MSEKLFLVKKTVNGILAERFGPYPWRDAEQLACEMAYKSQEYLNVFIDRVIFTVEEA